MLRSDVLQRHRALHDVLSPDDEVNIKRRKDRLPGASRERNITVSYFNSIDTFSP